MLDYNKNKLLDGDNTYTVRVIDIILIEVENALILFLN
jgi:hypothetical protein